MDQHRFTLLHSMLEDSRRLIAAAKVSRWDVLKWAVALNIATAAASVTLKETVKTRTPFISLVILSTLGSALLMAQYNNRAKTPKVQNVNPRILGI